MSVLLYRKLFH